MNEKQKEFGKFTAAQILEFINFLPQTQQDRSEYLADFRNNPHKLNENMSEPFKWSWAYELPIAEHIAKLVMECSAGEHLVALSVADDPQQAFLDDMKAQSDPSPISKNPQSILALLEALACSLECVVIYGRYAAVEKAGLSDLRFHDLWHTWASWHRQAGTSCDELKDLGGWKSRSMVDRYAKFATEHLTVAASRIESGRVANVMDLVTFLSRQESQKACA